MSNNEFEPTTEEIPMEERGREQEVAEQEEETGYADDKRRDESVLVMDESDPLFVRPDDSTITSEGPGGSIPNVGRDAGVMKRSMIHDKKQFLKDGLGLTVNKNDGDFTKDLFKHLRITISEKSNRISGAEYKGKKILFLRKNGRMEYSKSIRNKPYVDEFKELLKKADIDHQNTPAALAEKKAGGDLTQDTMNSIINNVTDRIGSEIDNSVEDITTNTVITENELREFRGILNVKGNSGAAKLEALKIESANWKNKAEEEGNTRKGKLYEAISKVADLKADEIRLRLNQKPVTEEVINMLKKETESNDLTKFERFKKWSRENLVSLSSLAISVAGIITTVVMAGRNVLKGGGNALSKFGKAVGNKIKKLAKKLGDNFGPIITALGTIISSIIKYLANLLLLLGENLWILFLAITYLIYNEYKSWRDSRRRNR